VRYTEVHDEVDRPGGIREVNRQLSTPLTPVVVTWVVFTNAQTLTLNYLFY
jgi:hypothetical protein